MRDLICHIQNDSFFTSSSRKREDRRERESYFTLHNNPFSSKPGLPQSHEQGLWRDTTNVAWQLHTTDGKSSAGWASQRDRGRVRQRHTRMLVCVWPCQKWHHSCPGNCCRLHTTKSVLLGGRVIAGHKWWSVPCPLPRHKGALDLLISWRSLNCSWFS